MHHGIVNEYFEATVSLNVLGAGGANLVVDFVIDTGCTEEMILPPGIIDRLHRTRSSDMVLTVADGTTDAYARYRVSVEWHSQPREAIAIRMGTEPLVGMRLLRGSNLSVDADPGGRVTITELPRQS